MQFEEILISRCTVYELARNTDRNETSRNSELKLLVETVIAQADFAEIQQNHSEQVNK